METKFIRDKCHPLRQSMVILTLFIYLTLHEWVGTMPHEVNAGVFRLESVELVGR